ncbi:MAG: hypothetical protein MJA31_07130, partial [Clostridia bacterium]|nr:hypothetical protein [Clostridia bacterium]
DYKLLLLDTNALREIVLNNDNSFLGFINRFIGNSNMYAPVFSIYNVIELFPYQDIYDNFIRVFSVVPCLMFLPYKIILNEEVNSLNNNRCFIINNKVAHAFTMLGSSSSYKLDIFMGKLWNDVELRNTITSEIEGLDEIAKAWNETKRSFLRLNYKINLKKLYLKLEKSAIIKDLKNHNIKVEDKIDIKKLPGARIMEYSHFMRVYDRKKLVTRNDVMDVKMSCSVPYVDAVITEAYQAELYRRAKSFITQLKDLEIYKVSILK